MAKALLILAAIVDIALAALLIGVSGFLFGTGPESMHGGAALMAGYAAAVIACVVAPIAGFIFNRRGNYTPGIHRLDAAGRRAAGAGDPAAVLNSPRK